VFLWKTVVMLTSKLEQGLSDWVQSYKWAGIISSVLFRQTHPSSLRYDIAKPKQITLV
jgi:hypothetical protein